MSEEKKAEIKRNAKVLITKNLEIKANRAQEEYLQQNGLSKEYINPTVPSQIVDALSGVATEEFLKYYPDTDEDTLDNNVQEYINQNYNDNFMLSQVEYRQNEDEIKEKMIDKLVMLVANSDKYNGVDRGAVFQQARSISTLRELHSYLTEDGIELFMEKYGLDNQSSKGNKK
ncbi:hypothetical protein [Lactobacillus sp.]|uniref:hypothetical protein n=1 Tax=Lactobacillus sp. TaxID=1591 RepID=UPI0019C83CB9|nr:hypothetical protein [Lactobacillus sp.]MBD5430517.1 hypothetical protein [Lactobacillus sp.]MBD5430808.1 hypothetical protein [Lactobacillus sp.]